MKISLASDHGGYLLKEDIKNYLLEKGYEVMDCGTNSLVSNGTCQYGIVVCTTGEGVCMTANKEHGIRCGLVYNEDVARLTREHNNANMMAIGAKFTSKEQALKYVDIFLNTEFLGGRHLRRVELIEK